jgi:hypothetical protein
MHEKIEILIHCYEHYVSYNNTVNNNTFALKLCLITLKKNLMIPEKKEKK